VRGRIFIPIELVFPCPKIAGATQDKCSKQQEAKKGRYSPEEVKQEIGTLVVLGQDVQLQGQRRFAASPR